MGNRLSGGHTSRRPMAPEVSQRRRRERKGRRRIAPAPKGVTARFPRDADGAALCPLSCPGHASWTTRVLAGGRGEGGGAGADQACRSAGQAFNPPLQTPQARRPAASEPLWTRRRGALVHSGRRLRCSPAVRADRVCGRRAASLAELCKCRAGGGGRVPRRLVVRCKRERGTKEGTARAVTGGDLGPFASQTRCSALGGSPSGQHTRRGSPSGGGGRNRAALDTGGSSRRLSPRPRARRQPLRRENCEILNVCQPSRCRHDLLQPRPETNAEQSTRTTSRSLAPCSPSIVPRGLPPPPPSLPQGLGAGPPRRGEPFGPPHAPESRPAG